MNTEDAALSLVAELYETATDHGNWQPVLTKISESLGASAIGCSIHDPTARNWERVRLGRELMLKP